MRLLTIEFEYARGIGENSGATNLSKEDLMVSLSMSERRALYILFLQKRGF